MPGSLATLQSSGHAVGYVQVETRESESQAASDALSAGQSVVVIAAAGMGKSRVLERVTAILRQRGQTVVGPSPELISGAHLRAVIACDDFDRELPNVVNGVAAAAGHGRGRRLLISARREDEAMRRLPPRARDCVQLHLAPLADDELLAVVAAHSVRPPDSFAGSNGNPALALLAGTGQGLPPGFVDLGDSCQRFIRNASVVGAAFVPELVLATLDVSPAEATRLLYEALGSGLLKEEDDRVRFRSDVVEKTLSESVPAPVRRLLHRQFSDWLAAHGGAPKELARHVQSAGLPAADAIRQLRAVGSGLLASDPASAAELLGVARTAAARIGTDRDPIDAELVTALLGAGEAGKAEGILREAIARGADADVTRGLMFQLSDALFLKDRVEESMRYLEVILRTPGLTATDRVRATAETSLRLVLTGRVADGGALASSSLAAARQAHDPLAEAHALGALAHSAYYTGAVRDALASAREAVVAADRAKSSAAGHKARYDLGWFLLHANELDESRLVFSSEIGRGPDRSWHIPIHLLGRGVTNYHAGRWVEAEADIRAALTDSGVIETAWDAAHASSVLAVLLARSGRVQDAAQILTPPEGDSDLRSPHFSGDARLWAEGLVLEAMGDYDAAVDRFSRSTTVLRDSGATVRLRWLAPDFARAAYFARCPLSSEWAVTTLEGIAERNNEPHFLGAAGVARAWLDADAQPALDAVVALAVRPGEQALAREATGLLLLREGEVTEAADHLIAARNQLEELGAAQDVRRVSRWLRDAGVRRGQHSRGASRRAAGSLTNAELTVAQLAAEGQSNAEIAARLFLSKRTVETQMSRVFAKLGIHRRTQLIGRQLP